MRLFEIMVEGWESRIGSKSGGGSSLLVCSSPLCAELPFCVVVESAKSRIHFGSSNTSSGIGSMPGGRGFCSSNRCLSVIDHGTKEPSILGCCQHTL